MTTSRSEFIPHTITECVRELSKLVPGADIGHISADASVTWMRSAGRESEDWSESFTVYVGNNLTVKEKTLPEVYEAARDYIWRAYGR